MKVIPEPTLRRLPVYYHFLVNLAEKGITEVSTTLISNELRYDPTQVRKDISSTGIIGKPKVGFNIKEVLTAIEQTLNWNNIHDAFIVGVGNLGSAIIGYDKFNDYGMNIIAGFDMDESRTGTHIGNVEIFHIDKLVNLALRMHINIGIITVPRAAAQGVADLMVAGGIKAIWNFAPVNLKVPTSVAVENVSFSNSLGVLTRKLLEILNK